jgi:acetyltransferase-like isoleucine patch superfamily enzyme
MPEVRIHPTALIEPGVRIGQGSSVWDNVHIRKDATLGEECIVGEKTYIAYGVKIGNRCKINASVYICAAVTIDDGVMIAAHTVFTNDRFPRATTPDLKKLLSSDLADDTPHTRVKEGATIGANCTIGPGLVIGKWSMVGMGAVVTKDVPDHNLVLGNPARKIGLVCKCGALMAKFPLETPSLECPECARLYAHVDGITVEVPE